MNHHLLIGLSGVIFLGVSAQWVASRLRVPSILLLLSFGLIAGPMTKLVDPDALLGPLLQPVVSLSVAVVLFEGGLTLKVRELHAVGGVFLRLTTLGALVSWIVTALAAHWLLGFDYGLATLLGAILIVTGPTVIGPLLRHLRLRGQVSTILRWEGIVIDPVGAVLAVMVFAVIRAGGTKQGAEEAALALLLTGVIGGALGILGALLLLVPLRRFWIPDSLQNPVTLMMVLVVFTVSHLLQHESGLLAVTVMGIAVANQRWVPVRHLVEFKENLSTLLISALFILLAARLRRDDLSRLDLSSLAFVGVLIFLARPLAVLVATVGTHLSGRERLLLAWMAPRGIVAAAVSSIFALELAGMNHSQADRLVPITFLVILVTVLVYGLTVPLLARRLGLATADPQGVLFVGAQPIVRELAVCLQSSGCPVFLIDSDRGNVLDARMRGLPAFHGSILAEQTLDEVNLNQMGRLVAVTHNDEVNALACVQFAEEFGRKEVYQVPPGTAEGRLQSVPEEKRGRLLFGPGKTLLWIEEHFGARPRVKATRLTEAFDFEAYRGLHGEKALPVLVVGEKGEVRLFTAENGPMPRPGDQIISFVVEQSSQLGPAPLEAVESQSG